jgi:hypothetical protein
MYLLILLVLVAGEQPAVTNAQFENETSCLKAMGKVMEMETNGSVRPKITIKARCVHQ